MDVSLVVSLISLAVAAGSLFLSVRVTRRQERLASEVTVGEMLVKLHELSMAVSRATNGALRVAQEALAVGDEITAAVAADAARRGSDAMSHCVDLRESLRNLSGSPNLGVLELQLVATHADLRSALVVAGELPEVVTDEDIEDVAGLLQGLLERLR